MSTNEKYGSYDPYYPGVYRPEDSKATEQTSKPVEEPVSAISTAGWFESERISEFPINNAFPKNTEQYMSKPSGYTGIVVIPYFREDNRASIHPLGITWKPDGVSVNTWKKLDKDRLFNENDFKKKSFDNKESSAEKAISETKRVSSSYNDSSDSVSTESNERHDPSEMPFLDHLEEFRWALLKSIITIIVAMFGAWYLTDWAFTQVIQFAKSANIPVMMNGILDPVLIRLQMALVIGGGLSLPLVFYFIWSFISPGLYANEKKWVLPMVFVSTGCFFAGAALAWFILIPYMIKFLKNFIPAGITMWITFKPFASLILKFTLAFGVIFEMPVVTFVLAKIGLVKYKWMAKYRGYALIIIFIISAVVTPTVDPISQTLMAIPLYVLYEISILVAMIAGRKTLM